MTWEKSDPLAKKRQIFLEKQLPRHPPVLREWFLQEFPHPNSWYEARSAFVRSSAVMSMVGYMVGLGDRHGENILLDSITGGVTHVDFSCLFNKGDRMEIPEVVPFRLTHNMVWAMGPTGYEGMFVEACEITVRLMRAHIEQLLSVVRPFIYDPLLEWNRNCKRDEYTEMTNQCGDRMEIPEVVPFRLTHNMVWAMGPTGYEGMFVEACEITVRLMRAHIEQLLSVVRPFIYDPLLEWNRNCKRDEYTEMTNQCGRENTLNIQHRLLGHVRNNDKVFTERVLSVEGQTQMLIAEATSIDNLCQMFIGWGAYL
ncbi:serine/threonine-protein kinase atr-like [Nilaparvata lugens]|uniref:serine/threonine-protein kinase atr-like n=1 Tax=Nilaparvata lugens TaxID=108931 RepID=UPI00193E91B3|nr:serine/threonine-protein kinase atr-like [Nilaparvata lugens]